MFKSPAQREWMFAHQADQRKGLGGSPGTGLPAFAPPVPKMGAQPLTMPTQAPMGHPGSASQSPHMPLGITGGPSTPNHFANIRNMLSRRAGGAPPPPAGGLKPAMPKPVRTF